MTDLQDHPEYRQLVNAVRAAPDDDLPRLVLADWLEEHDSPEWAEFIRVHCEAARHPHAARIWADTFTDADAVNPDWQAALTCARRVRELWPEVVGQLFPDDLTEGQTPEYPRQEYCFFSDVRQPALPMYRVYRGFVERVTCSTARWMGTGEHPGTGLRLVTRQPIREVVLRDRHFSEADARWVAVPDDNMTLIHPPERLPWRLAVHLRGERSRREGDGPRAWRVWMYPNTVVAFAALSAAAIAWALEEAGRVG